MELTELLLVIGDALAVGIGVALASVGLHSYERIAMKRFLVLYGSGVSAREQMSRAMPEQAKAGIAAWMAWSEKAGTAIVHLGAPVGNAAKISGGTAVDGQSEVSGFSILQAESREAVIALLQEHPHFMAPGASIEVHEFLPIPGM